MSLESKFSTKFTDFKTQDENASEEAASGRKKVLWNWNSQNPRHRAKNCATEDRKRKRRNNPITEKDAAELMSLPGCLRRKIVSGLEEKKFSEPVALFMSLAVSYEILPEKECFCCSLL